MFFTVNIRFLSEEAKTDEKSINAFRYAMSTVSNIEAGSINMLSNADDGSLCGIIVTNGNVRRLESNGGQLLSHDQAMQRGAVDDDDGIGRESFHKRMISSSGIDNKNIAFDDDDVNKAATTGSGRGLPLLPGSSNGEPNTLGRYDGGLNDPTPAPTQPPTPRPTYGPTAAPDPESFTLVILESAGDWDDAETAESEQSRVSSELNNAVSSGTFAYYLNNGAAIYGSNYMLDGSVMNAVDNLGTGDIDIEIGEVIIYNAPTSVPTTSLPTVTPTNSPVTSRPTVPGETNPPTSVPSSSIPTSVPTRGPTSQPSNSPTGQPTQVPTSPTSVPTSMPSTWGLDETDTSQEMILGMVLGISFGVLFLCIVGYTGYRLLKADKVKVAPAKGGEKEDEESKFEDPDEAGGPIEVSDLDLAAALKIVLKGRRGGGGGLFSSKNKYKIPAKAMKKISLLEAANTRIFSVSDAGLESVEKGYGGKSKFELEYDSDEERKDAAKRARKKRQAMGDVHDSDGDSSSSDDEETKMKRERDKDEFEEAAFRPKIKPLNFSLPGADPRVNPATAVRILGGSGNSLSMSMKDSAARPGSPDATMMSKRWGAQSMRVPTSDSLPASPSIRLSPLSNSYREPSRGGYTQGTGKSSMFGSPTRLFGGTATSSSSNKIVPGTLSLSPPLSSSSSLRMAPLGQSLEELAVTRSSKVGEISTRTGTVSVKPALAPAQKQLEHALLLTKPNISKEAMSSVQYVITSTLDTRNIRVLTRGYLDGRQIQSEGSFDAHYADTMNYAEVASPLEVAKELSERERRAFEEEFGTTIMLAQKQGRVYTEKDMCQVLSVSPEDLYQQYWEPAKKHHRVRKGIYIARFDGLAKHQCFEKLVSKSSVSPKKRAGSEKEKEANEEDLTRLEETKQAIYCINGFYSSMRASYHATDTNLQYFIVEWDSRDLSWADFNSTIVGDINPAIADSESIRGHLHREWSKMGLRSQPTRRDNCLHASVSALEGVRERLLWLKGSLLYTDLLGTRLLASRIPSATVMEWVTKNPTVFPFDMNILDVMHGKGASEVISTAIKIRHEDQRIAAKATAREVLTAEREGRPPPASASKKLPLHLAPRPTQGIKVNEGVMGTIAKKSMKTKRVSTTESAFLFTKPHANAPKVISLLKEVLEVFGVRILSQGKVVSSFIQANGMFDRQYRELVDYSDPPPPVTEKDKDEEPTPRTFELYDITLSEMEKETFKASFEGKTWDLLLRQKKLMTAAQVLEVCPLLDDESMYQLHSDSQVCVKIRKGLYVTRFDELPKKSRRKAPLYVVNAFFASMRNKYLDEKAVVNYMVLEWDSSHLSWNDFSGEVIGNIDPTKAQPGSIRHTISLDWEKLGLTQAPSLRDNGVHASSSAFEALRERLIWVKGSLLFTDLFGSRLLAARIPSGKVKIALEEKTEAGGQGKIRSKVRGKDSNECIEILLER